MNINEALTNELKSNLKTFDSFEKVVVNLLRILADKENKKFELDYRYKNIKFDAFFPDGIQNYNEPTIVEIKRINSRTINHISSIYQYLEQLKANYFILISDQKITKNQEYEIIDITSIINPNITVVFWGLDYLTSLIEDNLHRFSNKFFNSDKIIINNEIKRKKKFENIVSDENNNKIKELSIKFASGNISLFLGAGVSQSAGIVNWDMLISELFISLINENIESYKYSASQKEEIASQLQRMQNSSPLIDVRYLRSGLGNKFISIIKKALYKNKRRDSELIKSITKMCVPRLGIKNVITYNFDDILEKSLREAGVIHKPIYDDNYDLSNSDIGIYHVHGFLPEKNKINSEIVFSEESYHNVFLDPYSWSNIVQLNNLTESTCLLLGLSMTDPNLRRILEISAKKIKTPRHYLIIKRYTMDNDQKIQENISEDYMIAHHRILESSYLELGLNTIWVNEYDEIPSILDQIRTRSS